MFSSVFVSYSLMTVLMFLGLFLIALILLQRGRGGGLASAFGGMSGHSFAGTKAGDVFTRITIGVATAWILLCAASVLALQYSSSTLSKVDKDVLATKSLKEEGEADTIKKAKANEDVGAEGDAEFKPEVIAKPKEGDKPKGDDKPPAKTEGSKLDAPVTPATPGPAKTENETAPPKDEKPAVDGGEAQKPAAEAKPQTEPAPAEPKPAEPPAGDAKPVEPKPAEPKPDAKPE